MNLKASISRLFRQLARQSANGTEFRGSETQCPGCDREVSLWDFHRIPDMAARKNIGRSVGMCVPGRYATGDGEYGTFVYCCNCNGTLSLAEKKLLIWHIMAHAHACDEADALCRLDRGNHLCAQIDRGL